MSKYVVKPDLHIVNTRREESLTDVLVVFLATLAFVIFALVTFAFVIQQVAVRVAPATEQRLLSQALDLTPGEKIVNKDFLLLLAKVTPQEQSYNVHYKVECNDEVNAYALPGGTIILTQGLLESIKTEQGLAFVVGHEVGHLMNRDHLRGVGLWATMMFAKLFTGIGDFPFFDSLQVLFSSAYSRQQETRADDYAIARMKLVYDKIYNASEFLELAMMSATSSSEPIWFLSTHPQSTTRLENVRTKTNESVLNSSPIITPLSQKVLCDSGCTEECKN